MREQRSQEIFIKRFVRRSSHANDKCVDRPVGDHAGKHFLRLFAVRCIQDVEVELLSKIVEISLADVFRMAQGDHPRLI